MTIDKYTKVILTLIAVGVIGINFHLFNGGFVKDAYAAGGIQKVIICSDGYDCGYGASKNKKFIVGE